MKRILITGGPVYAHLDAVKIITNRFKGGLMCELAEALLAFDTQIVYLCAPKIGAKVPRTNERLSVAVHAGIADYQQKVLELAPSMDGVVLGAAVANLIPVQAFSGKFPSHNYLPGDVIPINFTIAPRVIDEVKEVAPHVHLFGYKLLSGASYEELVQAAYDIVLKSKAAAVFANDTEDLQRKYAVTKERGVHPLQQKDLAAWIWAILTDVYYATEFDRSKDIPEDTAQRVRTLVRNYADCFPVTETGLIFGTVAVRHADGFVTTSRGKRELDSIAYVTHVDHNLRQVWVAGDQKASLNAPLLARMFENPTVATILHYHAQMSSLPTYPYAPAGTVRDAERPNGASFNIEGHGCILLFDSEGRQL